MTKTFSNQNKGISFQKGKNGEVVAKTYGSFETKTEILKSFDIDTFSGIIDGANTEMELI